MFTQLFAESGLSLDRLKSLLEVGAAGSIVKAASGDPVRQSQYSRQIKELEEFFRIKLIERQGKGIRLTLGGKELARISRFFLLGLSNFKRGALAEGQAFRFGACATFIRHFLLPALSHPELQENVAHYTTETLGDQDIERRLHDLTLDFGIVCRETLSRPLQTKALGSWRLVLWIPKELRRSGAKAAKALSEQRLPMIFPAKELEGLGVVRAQKASLVCDNFMEAYAALQSHRLAAILPDFLGHPGSSFVRTPSPNINARVFNYHLAWNPRLLRLNPQAVRRRDMLVERLDLAMKGKIKG